jgi:ABC-type Na+ efflux pump permease subunit
VRRRKDENMTAGVLALNIDTWQKIEPFLLTAYAVILVLLIIYLFLVSRYFRTAGKEQKLIRLDVGKLAEEVHLLRQELKGGKERDSSGQSV